MSKTICLLCGKEFSSNQRMKSHMEKKVCQKKPHTCEKCGRCFSSNTWLKYHIEHNVCQKKQKIVLKIDQSKQIKEENYNNLTKEELVTKLIQSETEIRVLKEHPQTINNINLIVNFGQESIEEINKLCPQLMNDVIHKHLTHSIPFLTKHIHCNQDVFPQYSNVFIESYRNPYAMVYSDGQFHRQPKKQTIDQLIDECIQMLGNHVDDNVIDQRLIKKYELYRDSVDEDGSRRKELENELIGILLDQGDRLKLDNNFRSMLQEHIRK